MRTDRDIGYNELKANERMNLGGDFFTYGIVVNMLQMSYPVAATVAVAAIVAAAVAEVVVVDFLEVAGRNLVQSSCCCQYYRYRLGCLLGCVKQNILGYVKQNILPCGFQDWRH